MKKVINILILVICLFSLIGCTKKTALTEGNFKSIMSNNNFIVEDIPSEDKDITKILQASKSNKYKVEFYIVSNTKKAKSLYLETKTNFENSRGEKYTNGETNLKNYDKYTMTSNGKYNVISRIDNTYIYVDVIEDYKQDINELLKELGY